MDNILKELKTHLTMAKRQGNRSFVQNDNRSRDNRRGTNRPQRKLPRYQDGRKQNRARRLIPIQRPTLGEEEINGLDETLKIIPLGGLGEVGKNMTVIEYKNDIAIIDVGFGFPEDDQPGIDYVLPNISYLDGKQNKIRGIILTHGHMDHVGGLPYLINKLGNPEVYAANMTRGIVIKRQQEFPHLPEPEINLVKAGEIIRLGEIEIEFFHVNHNIPDDTALIISTPAGRIVHIADFKLDPTPLNEKPADLEFIKSIGDRGVTVLMSDSTGAEKEGTTPSEKIIQENLETIFRESKGRIITATFSSLINRIQQIITLSEKYNRRVAFDGFSLKSNVEFAKESGHVLIKKHTQIPIDQIDNYPDQNVTVIGTGAQGEERAVLMRIASGEHRHIKLKKTDSVVFSSSVIPGNERTVQRLKDLLYRVGTKVYHSGLMDVHASGHAQQEDLKKMIRMIRPKFLMPIHGYYSMMVSHGNLGQTEGMPEENIIIADNGSIIHVLDPEPTSHLKNGWANGENSGSFVAHPLTAGNTPRIAQYQGASWWFNRKVAPSDTVMVDGLGIGDIGNVVLRDRQVLSEDGMFVIITLVEGKTGKVRGSPDIISRGFVYLKENKELLAQARKKIRFIVERKTTHPINWVDLKDMIRDEIGLFLFQKTERRPMVLPVVIEV